MTLIQYALDAGPEGGNVTNANSSSIASSLTLSSTTTYAAVYAGHGPFGMKVDCKAGGQAFRRWQFAGAAAVANWALSVVFTMPTSLPGNRIILLNATNGSDATRLQIGLSAGGNLEVSDTGDAHFGTIVTGVTLGAKYRVTLVVTGGSTTTGAVVAKAYSGTTSWTTSVGSTVNVSTWNLGADTVSRFNFGVVSNSAAATIVGVDDVQLDDGGTTEIPDWANIPPTVTTSPNQTVAPGDTVNVTSTATDSDGSVVSRAWTFDYPTSGAPTLTGASTANASFTAGAAGSLYILRHTATDDLSGTGSATTEVRVPLSGAGLVGARPPALNGSGVFTRVGSATTDGAALADEDATTRLESAAVTGTAQEHAVRLPPFPAGIASLSFKVNLSQDTAGTTTVKVRLRDGGPSGTIRQEWTQAVTTTDTQYTFTVGSPGAITDPGSLWVSVVASS